MLKEYLIMDILTETEAWYEALSRAVKTCKFAGSHNIFTPQALVEEILSKTPLEGKILVLFNIEIVVSLLYTFNINKSDITIYVDSPLKAKLANELGVNVITKNIFEIRHMKFNVVIGNPPYQDKKGNENSTNSADLYARFVYKAFELSDKYVALIIPSAWSGPKRSKLKEFLFDENQPVVFNTHGKKWFNVEMNTCYFISHINRKGITRVTDATGYGLDINLDRNIAIPIDLTTFSLRTKIEKFAKKTNMSHRWLRGSLSLNKLHPVEIGAEFICAVGKKNDPLKVEVIDKKAEQTGYGLNKLVIPNMGGPNNIGNIKVAKKNQVGGHSVVFITSENVDELSSIKAYLESKVIKFLISAVKISTPNSKQLFKFIPEVDFSQHWTDEELYVHFGLTQEEIDYIESNVK